MNSRLQEQLARALVEVTRRLAGTGDEIVLLYSGGLDSSVLAWILRDRPKTRLVTIGLPGTTDLRAARHGADLIRLPWNGIELTTHQVTEAWARWSPLLLRRTEPSRSVQLSLAIAFEQAPPGRLVLGQGADELFWGYARFQRLDLEAGIAEASRSRRALLEHELPLTYRIARKLGRILLLPYLEPAWSESVLRAPPQLHAPTTARKPLLRQIAASLGLPTSLVEAPKKAIQYGSGVSATLRSLIGPDDEKALAAKRGSPPLRGAPGPVKESP